MYRLLNLLLVSGVNMKNSSNKIDDFSTESVNENILIDTAEIDQEISKYSVSSVMNTRRRLERCIEDRRLAKDLRDFDFDI